MASPFDFSQFADPVDEDIGMAPLPEPSAIPDFSSIADPAPAETPRPIDPKYPYSAERPPDPYEFIKERKTVDGVEYLLHGPTGTIYDTRPDAQGGLPVVTDPKVLQAFGKSQPTKKALREKGAVDALYPDADAPFDQGEFMNSFGRAATAQNMQLSGRTILAIEEANGSTDLIDDANKMIETGERWDKGIAPSRAPQFKDIRPFEQGGGERLSLWFANAAGQALGTSLVPLVGGFAGGAGGRRLAGRPGSVVGAVAGAFAGSNALNIGSMHQTLEEEGVTDPKFRGKVAITAGMMMSTLDSLVPGQIASKFTGAARKEVERTIVRRVMAEMAKTGAKESATEAAQQTIESTTGKVAAGKELSIDAIREIAGKVLEAAAQGMVGGAVLGGPAGALERPAKQAPPPPGVEEIGTMADGTTVWQDNTGKRYTGGPGTGWTPLPSAAPPRGAPGAPQQEPTLDFSEFADPAGPSPQPEGQGTALPEGPGGAVEGGRSAAVPPVGTAPLAPGFALEPVAPVAPSPRSIIGASRKQVTETVKVNEAYGPRRPGRPAEGIRNLATTAAGETGMDEITFTSGVGKWISPGGRAKGQKTTAHATGDALDVTGFKTEAEKFKFIENAVANGATGVGIYKDGSVHIDTRRERHWNWGNKANDVLLTAAINRGKARRAGKPLPEVEVAATAPVEKPVDFSQVADAVPEPGTRAAPSEDIEAVRTQVNLEPTEAQKEAGNYKKGHAVVGGIDITIENPLGSERSGVDEKGKPWSVTMPADYGYIKRSEGKDGDQVDVYVGPDPQSEDVFVIDQKNLATGAFDEHKAVMGVKDEAEARRLYEKAFSDKKGAQRIMGVKRMPLSAFKDWVAKGIRNKPVSVPAKVSPGEAARLARVAEAEEYQVKHRPRIETEALPNAKHPQGVNWAEIQTLELEGKWAASAGFNLPGRGSGGMPSLETPRYATKQEAQQAMAEKILASVGEDETGKEAVAIRKWAQKFIRKPFVEPVKAEEKPKAEEKKPEEKPQVEEKKPEPEEKPKAEGPKRGEPIIATGVVLRTQSGRETSPAPKIAITSDRTAANTIKRMNDWLVAEAIKEAEASNAASHVKAMLGEMQKEKSLTQSDQDMVNMILFGDPLGPTADDIVTKVEEEEKPAPAAAIKPEKKEPAAKIEDAGEKIGGARKDWRERGLEIDDLGAMTDAEKAAYTTKENVWPRPDYAAMVEGGMEPEAAYYAKLLYDRIPVHPLADNRQKHYIAAIDLLRRAIGETKTVEDITGSKFAAILDQEFLKSSAEAKELATEFATKPDGRDALQGMGKRRGKYNTTRFKTSFSWSEQQRARRAVVDGWPNGEAWARFFTLREHKRDDKILWRVYKKNGAFIGEFATKEEAKAAAKAAHEATQTGIDDGKGEPKLPDRPHLDTLRRSGPDYRSGRNVTSEDFIKDFGFRGVEFGDWVASDERQKIVNLGYDAFQDLAWALGVPPKAISLDGTLGIGFGSRGRGGRAAAHYESHKLVINMTKLRGAGSLAHEWGHALDHYLGELSEGKRYAGLPKSISGWRDIKKFPPLNGLPPRLRGASNELMKALYFRPETNGEMRARLDRSIADAVSGVSGWEAHRDRLRQEAKTNPAKRNGLLRQAMTAEGKAEQWRNILHHRKDARAMPRESMRMKDRPTLYFNEARKLSGQGDYWIRGNEMLARSFESYVFDQIVAKQRTSEYLVHGVEETRYAIGFRGNPYPAGDERQAINLAYGKLLDAIHVVEGKGGLGSRIEGAPGAIEYQSETNAIVPLDDVAVPIDVPPTGGEQTETAAEAQAVAKRDELLSALLFHFAGDGSFASITEARKFAAEKGFKAEPGTIEAKQLDEKIELAVVLAAKIAATNATDPLAAYRALVDLYGRQPNLGVRTAKSMADQAYSTPMPLAYLAQQLAGITGDTTVYEPTAGNGALIFLTSPGNVIANEIDPLRAEQLRQQGYKVTNVDASEPGQASVIANTEAKDVVIANPPFGVIYEGEPSTPKVFTVDGWTTTQIDMAISLQALKAMKPDGKAVLLVASINPNAQGQKARFEAYNVKARREFYWRLYNSYNVVDHFTVSGDLYKKQGAGWPIDVFVIDGKQKSARGLPAVQLPVLYDSWNALEAKLAHEGNQVPAQPGKRPLADVGGRRGELGGPGGRDRADVRGEQPVAGVGPAADETGPVDVRGQPDLGSGPGVGELQPGQPATEELGPSQRGGSTRLGEPSSDLDLETAFDNLLEELFPEEKAKTAAAEPAQPTAAPVTKAVSAVVKTAKGMDEVASGLFQLFADPNKLNIGLNFDEETYKRAKPMFEQAYAHFKDAAKDAVDAMRLLMLDLIKTYNFSKDMIARMRPYITRFIDEKVLGQKPEERPKGGPTPKGIEQETESQKAYRPKSKAEGLGTLVPVNMLTQTAEALDAVEAQKGDIDQWMAGELGYESPEDLAKVMGAEQVDAAALALVNVEKGAAFIIGDQTGIGKGRVVAAMLRYALRKGMTPIFVTAKPNLYGDIIRDLNDIRVPEMLGRDVRFFMTNQNEEVPIDSEALTWYAEKEIALAEGDKPPPRSGKFLKSPGKTEYEKQLQAIASEGGAGVDKSFDIILTTYNQMQTVQGLSPPRRALIAQLSPGAFLVMDESHNAGGTGPNLRGPTKDKQGKPLPDDASVFFRKVAAAAQSVMFSSATYAKRPDVMDLYARTDMALAVDKVEQLGPLIQRGGIPMQQVVASMLTKAGQYIRRERSFDGISYEVTPVEIDEDAYGTFSHSMRAIFDFDSTLHESDFWDDILAELAAEGAGTGKDTAIGEAGARSTTFSSIMHNMVNQMLLSIKANSVADMAIEAIERGEKPIITVSHTMGQFIADAAETMGLRPRDAFNQSFRHVAKRYLLRTMRVSVKDHDGNTTYIQIDPDRLPPDLRRIYDNAGAVIDGMSDEDMPLSPIDWIKFRITEAGHKVGEITGRKHILNYEDKAKAKYGVRTDGEIAIAGRALVIDRYNNEIDSKKENHAIIMNRAGSTGLSLHAYYKFKNQKKRLMIVAQAEGNIDDHMQLLGRVNRTGQTVKPAYIQAYADIPAEARPAAVLAKKMASLAANTTASRRTALSAKDTVDYMNAYGDQVVAQMLAEDPTLMRLTGIVLKDTNEGLAAKFTGKLTLLTVPEQRTILDNLTQRYTELVASLDALGENTLEAKSLDLGARTVDTDILRDAKGTSPFAQAAILETVEVKTEGRAMTLAEITERIADHLEIEVSQDVTGEEARFEAVTRAADNENTSRMLYWAKKAEDRYAEETRGIKSDDIRDRERQKRADQEQRWRDIYATVAAGTTFEMTFADNPPMPAIALEVSRRETSKKGGGDPLAFGAWSVRFAVPDNAREIIVPFSSIALPSDRTADQAADTTRRVTVAPLSWSTKPKMVYEEFARARMAGVETRYIVTGNVLAGYKQTGGSGQIVNFTDDSGAVRPGVLMPKSFKKKEFMEKRAVPLLTGEQVTSFLQQVPERTNVDFEGKIGTISRYDGGYNFSINAGRGTGGRFFLNEAVRRASRDGFIKRGQNMTYATESLDTAKRLIDALAAAGAVFHVETHQEIATDVVRRFPAVPSPSGPAVFGTTGRQAPVFFSALVRAVEAMKQEKAPAAQWMATIRNAPGVKAEEIAWVGLEDWLSAQTGSVSKTALLDFLRANQVQVQEVVKGESQSERSAEERATIDEAIDFIIQKTGKDPEEEWAYSDHADYVTLAQEMGFEGDAVSAATPFATKFQSYQLPGGQNYRELLIRLPFEPVTVDTTGWTVRDNGPTATFAATILDANGNEIGVTDDEVSDDADIIYQAGQRLQAERQKQRGVFRSGHYDEPNVVAHVRFNERTVPVDAPASVGDIGERIRQAVGAKRIESLGSGAPETAIRKGLVTEAEAAKFSVARGFMNMPFKTQNRVLFIEEIQSDWHQKGRKLGYDDPAAKAKFEAEKEAKFREIEGLIARTVALKMQTNRILPFGSDEWREAYRRQTIAEGQLLDLQNAYDRLRPPAQTGIPDAPFKTTWPELAMKRMLRYAAENGFDQVAWTPGEVQAERYDLSKQIESVDVERLSNEKFRTVMTGKYGEARGAGEPTAEQLPYWVGKDFAQKIVDDLKEPGDKKNYQGLDLKVGGEGMRGFYDKMLVDTANRLGKKFGTRVQKTAINLTDMPASEYDKYPPDHPYVTKNRPSVHSMDITPAMRESVMRGQPLFNAPPVGRLAATTFVASQRQIAEANDRAQAIAQRILGRKITLTVVGQMPADIPADFIAAYNPKERAIWLSMKAANDMAHNIGHESLHGLRNSGAIDAREWRVLVAAAKKQGLVADITEPRMEIYRENYLRRYRLTEARFIELIEEEGVADMFGAYVNGYESGSLAADGIMARIKEYIEALLNLMNRMGFTSATRIMREANQGALIPKIDLTRPSSTLYGTTERTTGEGAGPGDIGPVPQEGSEEELSMLAGNINLAYINTPEDIHDVLRTVADKAEGFIGERRGVISNRQTRALASELGMTAAKLGQRKTGMAFNAESIFAARVLLIKSAKRLKSLAAQAARSRTADDLAVFHKAFTRHRAIQEQVAGMTAEAGRALQQFRMLAGDTYFDAIRRVMDEAHIRDPNAPFGSRNRWGPEAVQTLADMIDALDDPAQIGRFTAQAYKVTIGDMLREIWINALLSGLRTHVVNMMSNLITAAWQIPETAVASAIGALHGGEKVHVKETVARLTGLIEGTKEGLVAAAVAFKTGEPSDVVSKLEVHHRKAVPGLIGEIVRIPGRALMAEDEFFKILNYRAELNALATRQAMDEARIGSDLARRIVELRETPTGAMDKQAHAAALYNTYQKRMGPIGQAVMKIRDSVPGAWLILPFLRTPANIIVYAAERTPLGFLMKQVRDNVKGVNGNVARDTELARMFLGSAIAATVASLVISGMISGSGPPDKDEQNLKRLTGWQPYSIKIGNTWYSYQRFDPWSLIVGITADAVELSREIGAAHASIDKIGAMIVGSISQNLFNKTWLRGPADFIAAIQNPDRYGESYIRSLSGTLVPTGVAQVAQTIDPVLRDARTITDQLKSRIPYKSMELMPRRNVFGEEIRREGALGPDIASSIFMSTERNIPAVDAMLDVHYTPGTPRREINNHELTPQQYDDYAKMAGEFARQKLERVNFSGKVWQGLADETRIKFFKKTFDQARENARTLMKRRYRELAKKAGT